MGLQERCKRAGGSFNSLVQFAKMLFSCSGVQCLDTHILFCLCACIYTYVYIHIIDR